MITKHNVEIWVGMSGSARHSFKTISINKIFMRIIRKKHVKNGIRDEMTSTRTTEKFF